MSEQVGLAVAAKMCSNGGDEEALDTEEAVCNKQHCEETTEKVPDGTQGGNKVWCPLKRSTANVSSVFPMSFKNRASD